MTKRLFTFLILIYLSHATLGQKHFQVAFKLDTSLVLKKVRYQYDDGKRIVFLGDSISKSPNVVIRGKYFGTFATLDIIYNNKDGMLYVSKYLIGDKPAQIDLYYKPNVDQLLLHKRLVNARAVYDVSSNKTYRDLINYNREENLAVYNFTQQYKSELKTNDSLQKVYWGMLRSVNQRTLGFLKQHADDYFSFWYFQHEIATSLGAGNPDTALLREQLSYLQTTFPQKITQSFEGREMIKSFKRALNPLKTNFNAPNFSVKTIDGKNLKLSDLKGKFVLFDFWATWCGPCMKEIPFVKSLRDKYPESKLAIIGISRDSDYAKMKRTIKDMHMNWYHYFDKETDISRLYGVNVFPAYFLVNQQGKIIYTSDNIRNDAAELTEALDHVME